MSHTNNKLRTEIRTRLLRFTNCRERAYNVMRKKGYPIPDFTAKIASILFIRIHLQASEAWSLDAHVRMVAATLRKHIETILPYEFHDEPRVRTYRQRIVDLLKFCDEYAEKHHLFIKPQAA